MYIRKDIHQALNAAGNYNNKGQDWTKLNITRLNDSHTTFFVSIFESGNFCVDYNKIRNYDVSKSLRKCFEVAWQ